MEVSFDLARFLERSRKLDLSGIDFDRAGDYPLDEGEARCLRYMMDIESHTLCYLRDVLNAGAGADPEIADFLGCWLYEEAYHGRAIERFLSSAGRGRPLAVCGRHEPSLGERVEDLLTRAASAALGSDFVTVYMAWAAIQEHSTLNGYVCMAKNTRNPVLAELLRRIARDESRHFGFYYFKAHQGLEGKPRVQALVRALLRLFWTPVGEGVKPASETDFLITYIFDGPEGRAALKRIDETMARLPGLEGFDLMSRRMAKAWRRRAGPEGYGRVRKERKATAVPA